MALGLLASYLIATSSTTLHQLLSQTTTGINRQVEETIDYLFGNPAGLKLNGELSRFIGKSVFRFC